MKDKGPLLILILAVLLGAIFVGGILEPTEGDPNSTAMPIQTTTQNYCCDTGSSTSCQPQRGPGQIIVYNNQEYGLLRTNITLFEGNLHLKDSGVRVNNDPIILNSSDSHRASPPNDPTVQVMTAACRPNGGDLYFKKTPPDRNIFNVSMTAQQLDSLLREYCIAIPDDQIIFVCKDNCFPASCPAPYNDGSATCYGDDTSIYDVYFKLADFPNPGVPDFIKNCDLESFLSNQATSSAQQSQQRIIYPSGSNLSRPNLHIGTFSITEEVIQGIIPWLSPLCKPAVYLYPEKTSNVHVVVKPQGKLTYTDPLYPSGGWNVVAEPNGTIHSQNATYPYLYYEAEIPDSSYQKPEKGFVVERHEVRSLLIKLLPQLGLNEKETTEFIEYWVNVLPQAPYFFVGMLEQKEIDLIAPLFVNPKPKTVIRIALFFEALEEFQTVPEPDIQTPIRSGFTVVEWGGIFKKNPQYNFSCFM